MESSMQDIHMQMRLVEATATVAVRSRFSSLYDELFGEAMGEEGGAVLRRKDNRISWLAGVKVDKQCKTSTTMNIDVAQEVSVPLSPTAAEAKPTLDRGVMYSHIPEAEGEGDSDVDTVVQEHLLDPTLAAIAPSTASDYGSEGGSRIACKNTTDKRKTDKRKRKATRKAKRKDKSKCKNTGMDMTKFVLAESTATPPTEAPTEEGKASFQEGLNSIPNMSRYLKNQQDDGCDRDDRVALVPCQSTAVPTAPKTDMGEESKRKRSDEAAGMVCSTSPCAPPSAKRARSSATANERATGGRTKASANAAQTAEASVDQHVSSEIPSASPSRPSSPGTSRKRSRVVHNTESSSDVVAPPPPSPSPSSCQHKPSLRTSPRLRNACKCGIGGDGIAVTTATAATAVASTGATGSPIDGDRTISGVVRDENNNGPPSVASTSTPVASHTRGADETSNSSTQASSEVVRESPGCREERKSNVKNYTQEGEETGRTKTEGVGPRLLRARQERERRRAAAAQAIKVEAVANGKQDVAAAVVSPDCGNNGSGGGDDIVNGRSVVQGGADANQRQHDGCRQDPEASSKTRGSVSCDGQNWRNCGDGTRPGEQSVARGITDRGNTTDGGVSCSHLHSERGQRGATQDNSKGAAVGTRTCAPSKRDSDHVPGGSECGHMRSSRRGTEKSAGARLGGRDGRYNGNARRYSGGSTTETSLQRPRGGGEIRATAQASSGWFTNIKLSDLTGHSRNGGGGSSSNNNEAVQGPILSSDPLRQQQQQCGRWEEARGEQWLESETASLSDVRRRNAAREPQPAEGVFSSRHSRPEPGYGGSGGGGSDTWNPVNSMTTSGSTSWYGSSSPPMGEYARGGSRGGRDERRGGSVECVPSHAGRGGRCMTREVLHAEAGFTCHTPTQQLGGSVGGGRGDTEHVFDSGSHGGDTWDHNLVLHQSWNQRRDGGQFFRGRGIGRFALDVYDHDDDINDDDVAAEEEEEKGSRNAVNWIHQRSYGGGNGGGGSLVGGVGGELISPPPRFLRDGPSA